MKGKFSPKHPEKYRGDPEEIVYRSSWEYDMMVYFDKRDEILWWSSEEKCLWYYDPVTKKNRRYFPDFIIHFKDRNGIHKTQMLEVKPQHQVDGPPVNPKRRTKGWVNAVKTYITNQAKWENAAKICEDRGWDFRLITEDTVKKWKR